MRAIDNVPARRLGGHLRALRESRGLTRAEVADATGIDVHDLAGWERGRDRPRDEAASALALVYECGVDDLEPRQNVSEVRVTKASLKVGSVERPLNGELDPETVLEHYLDAIYELRGLKPGRDLTLRQKDLAELADALGDSADEIETRLVQLIRCTRAEARAIRKALLKRRVLVPAAGVVLGLGGLTPALASGSSGDGDGSTPTTVVESVDESETVVQTSVPVDEPVGESPADVPEPPVEVPEPPAVPAPPVEDPAPPVAEEPDDDWAEIIDPLVVERGDDWAEIIDPLVIEREETAG